MGNRLFVILLTLLLLLSGLPRTAMAATGTTVSLSVSVASAGETVTASGTSDANTWIAVKVLDSAGNIVFLDFVKSGADGSYSCPFIVPAVADGILRVIGGYGSNAAKAELTVTGGTTYTVTFDSQGGSAVASINNVTTGSAISAPATPARSGNTFGGWYKEAACTNAWNFGTDTVTANMTLYAKWTANLPGTYIVNFNSQGGSAVSSINNVTTGSAISAPAAPARSGNTFGGWYKEAACINAWNFSTDTVTADMTLYAKWTANPQTTCTVAFDSQGGSAVSSINNVTTGSAISAPAAPARSGNTFGGWYKEAACTNAWNFGTDTVTADITLYAKWTANPQTTCTVAFDSQGGSAVSSINNVTTGSAISAPAAPARSGNTFGGWYKEAACINAWNFSTDTVTADMTLYAKWTANPQTTCTVAFDSQGGSAVSSISGVTTGSAISAPAAPARSGNTFGGWYKEAACTNAWNFGTDTVTADMTLYAKWTANPQTTCTVAFDSQGGSTVSSISGVTIGSAISAPAAPARSGNTFGGWYKEAACTNAWNFGTDTVTADITLYAKWTANPQTTCTVAFDSQGGSTVSSISGVTIGSAISAPAAPVRSGNTFGGWYKEAACTNAWNFGTDTVTADITLYAKWTANPQTTCTVAFDSQGGSMVLSINNVTTGSAISAPAAPTRSGYTFGGWYREAACTNAWNFSTDTVTADITLYAKWTANPTYSGGGHGGYNPSPTSSTINGSVVDGTIGAKISNLTATVSIDRNGNYTITMKAAQIFMLKQPDGSASPLGDISQVAIASAAGTPVAIAPDGTIQVPNLVKGTDNKFNITYDLGSGQKITIGTMNIQIDSRGAINLTTSLIDPYGIITDAATGKALAGVNVTLYYAGTERNKAAGKTPDTVVALPSIAGFKPNNNQNPQTSDSSGAYGFMVFPTTDYYIVATKDGYAPYTSPTIFVEQEIVRWDFKMSPTTSRITRLAGQSRVDTALAIAQAEYTGKVSNVILATADNYPDALAGSVLAYKLNAPILLVGNSEADQAKVLDYLKSNLDPAGSVYILGGTAVVSSTLENEVTASGFTHIVRIAGTDRYSTSAQIAEQMAIQTGTPVVLVSGENYPDALSISSVAAQKQFPILLVLKDGLSDSISREIAAIKPSKVYIIGGEGVISAAAENQVSQITGLPQTNIVRIGGADRYATSLDVAQYFNLGGQNVCIATGGNFPDALAGSVYAANHNAPIILADGSLSDQVLNYLQTKKLTGATLFGGEAVVSQGIEQQLGQLIGK